MFGLDRRLHVRFDMLDDSVEREQLKQRWVRQPWFPACGDAVVAIRVRLHVQG